jgi:hypothetical protein
MGSSLPWTISTGARSRRADGSLAARTLSKGPRSAPGRNVSAAFSGGHEPGARRSSIPPTLAPASGGGRDG